MWQTRLEENSPDPASQQKEGKSDIASRPAEPPNVLNVGPPELRRMDGERVSREVLFKDATVRIVDIDSQKGPTWSSLS